MSASTATNTATAMVMNTASMLARAMWPWIIAQTPIRTLTAVISPTSDRASNTAKATARATGMEPRTAPAAYDPAWGPFPHERHWGFEDVASDIGYRDGVNAGLKDFREHHSYRPHDHEAWKDGDHGYDKSFGEKDEYKRAYRAAYEAGYRAGFGLR